MRALLTAVLVLVGCGHASSETASPPPSSAPPTTTAAVDDEAADTCTVDGVQGQPASMLWIPAGCTLSTHGSPSAPELVQDADRFAAMLRCEAGATPPVVDFAVNDLYAYATSMGPAYAGGEILDDGTTITMIEHDRSPCPNDPMPYPMQQTSALLVPHGTTRTFRPLACTLPTHCP